MVLQSSFIFRYEVPFCLEKHLPKMNCIYYTMQYMSYELNLCSYLGLLACKLNKMSSFDFKNVSNIRYINQHTKHGLRCNIKCAYAIHVMSKSLNITINNKPFVLTKNMICFINNPTSQQLSIFSHGSYLLLTLHKYKIFHNNKIWNCHL
jgi:hypothetical protein